MKTRALPITLAVCLGILLIPLAGCDQDNSVVQTERDAKGNTSIHVDGEKADENIDQAKEDLERAGEQIQQGAEQVGDAIQRGAERVEAEVGPVVREVLDDAEISAKIKAKLIADPEVAGIHIDVDTVDGRVTLNGKVASEDQRAEAEKLASRTDGVKQVINLIQVAGEDAAPAPPPSGS